MDKITAQAVADHAIIAEIYLRMTCAAIYRSSGTALIALTITEKRRKVRVE